MKKLPADIDVLLEPWLMADDDEADAILSRLVTTHIGPVITGVVRYKLHFSAHRAADQAEADDIRQEVLLQLLTALKILRRQPEERPIRNVRAFAAVIAHRACARWMRRQFPERHALKNRVRYLLTHQKGLALWQNENQLVAGFAAWQGQRGIATRGQVGSLSDDPRLPGRIRSLRTGRKHGESSEILEAIFNHLGSPIEFNDLIATLAALLQIRDQPLESTDLNENEIALRDAREGGDAAWHIEKRMFLQRLWEEVRLLPLKQRAALLLNLKDDAGQGCINLFPAAGIASVRELAKTLEMTAEEFAELWNELPLDDAGIAERLQLTRQQVINARKSGRERLTRRLRGFI